MFSEHHLFFFRGFTIVAGKEWIGGHGVGRAGRVVAGLLASLFGVFLKSAGPGAKDFGQMVQAGAATSSHGWDIVADRLHLPVVFTEGILRLILARWDAANALFHLRV